MKTNKQIIEEILILVKLGLFHEIPENWSIGETLRKGFIDFVYKSELDSKFDIYRSYAKRNRLKYRTIKGVEFKPGNFRIYLP